jgi:ribosomal-protein-alanine N-acetyltransferase
MIRSDRLLLVPFKEEFIKDKYLSWLNNSELMKFSEQRHTMHTKETCLNYLNSFIGNDHLYLAIFDRETNEHLGNVNAYIDIVNQTADMGILIGLGGDKKGIGLEAWCALMDYLFLEKNIRKITAGTMEKNIPMLKIMERSHMAIEGRRRKQLLFQGEEVDVVLAGILKTEYINWHKNKSGAVPKS